MSYDVCCMQHAVPNLPLLLSEVHTFSFDNQEINANNHALQLIHSLQNKQLILAINMS